MWRNLVLCVVAWGCLELISPALADTPSVWSHNGSTVELLADGSNRIFQYKDPRAGMQDEGVQPGTILFRGSRSGNTYSGTAYVFSHRCGAVPYPVRGTVAGDQREITLRGNAPSGLSNACRPNAWKPNVLVFALIDTPEPTPEGEDVATTSSVTPLVGQVFQDNWNGCQSGDSNACDRALNTDGITEQTRSTLNGWRNDIVQKYNDEQRRAALGEEQQQDLDRQKKGADDARQTAEQALALLNQQRDQEAADLKSFDSDLTSCKSYDLYACNRALGYQKITMVDRDSATEWRRTRLALLDDRNLCESGSSQACAAALRSPALLPAEQSDLQKMYERSSLLARLAGFGSLVGATTVQSLNGVFDASASLTNQVAGLPPSTHITTALALVFALATLALYLRQRKLHPQSDAPRDDPNAKRSAPNFVGDSSGESKPISQGAHKTGDQVPPVRPAKTETTAAKKTPAPPPSSPPSVPDPLTASQALRLAWSYMDELHDLGGEGVDPQKVAELRSTMALATKQLDIAWRADPTAVLEETDADGTAIAMTQARIRGLLLLKEAITYMIDAPAKATSLMQRATEVDPEFALAHQSLGIQYFDHRQKSAAVAALERALLLEPNNIDTIKALDRARNMSATEAFTFKAGRAADATMNAGIRTYNGFVFVANIFIYAWNVFAFTWNVVTFPLRLMGRILGFVDRLW